MTTVDRALRILLLTTRDIGQRATGRIVVLRTHAEALTALGHEVTIAVVSPHPPADNAWTRRFHTVHVRAPRLPVVAGSAVRALTVGRMSLNESLFVDRRVRRAVAALAARLAADLVVVDSLRLSSATTAIGAPVVVDLDDLLSARYDRQRATGRDEPRAVLGFAAARIPGFLQPAAGRGALALLGWEARRLTDREHAVSEQAAAVSLVSAQEVEVLRRRTGRDVVWLPPAVPIPERPVPQRPGLVFLGGLDYLPNAQAVRFLRDQVLPLLDRDDPCHVLHVVGHCPDDLRPEFEVPGIVLHGYADDLHAALDRRLLVAPLEAGGIKLKVLDGMAHGLPVVGTAGTFEGLDLPDALRLQAESGPELAELVRSLAADEDRCRALGAQAREFVRKSFSTDAAVHRWRGLLDGLTAADGRRA